MSLRSSLFLALASIVGAHALAWLLVDVLPDAAIVSLGLEAARQGVVAAFHAAHETRSYGQVLAVLAHFNLGVTLDGNPVTNELSVAIGTSLPRLLAAFALVIVSGIFVALTVAEKDKKFDWAVSFMSFLPPYLLPFLGLLFLLSWGKMTSAANADALAPAVATLATAGAAALIAAQCAAVMRRNLQSEHARTLLACGAQPLYLRVRLLHNVAAEVIPSLEKVITSMIAALLFAEPVLNLSGFGATAVRAVRRADADLILGVTLTIAFAIGLSRLVSLSIRYSYGLRS